MSCEDENELIGPRAKFVHSADGLLVSFIDSSESGSGAIVLWNWDFGDGNTSALQNPTHNFDTSGTYNVRLTVLDENDLANTTDTIPIFVQPNGPIANFGFSINGLTAVFIDSSIAGDEPIVQWNWDFGDGNISNEQSPTHTFDSVGVYEVTLSVTDVNGISNLSMPVTVLIVPENNSPSVALVSEPESPVFEFVTFSCLASDDTGVDRVELWVDGNYASVYDDSEPYELVWNTTTFEDSSTHLVVIKAFDIFGNSNETPAVALTVVNAIAKPTPPILYPVVYADGTFSVSWSANLDNDFMSYTLFEGFTDDVSSMDSIYYTRDATDTTFTISGIPELDHSRYYKIEVSDTFGLVSTSRVEQGISQTIWSRTYPDSLVAYLPDWGNSIIEINGDYFVGGVGEYSTGRLLKIDRTGNRLYQRRFTSSIAYINEMLTFDDDVIYAVGGQYDEIKILAIESITGEIINDYYIGSAIGGSSWAYGVIKPHDNQPFISQNDVMLVHGEMDGIASIYAFSTSGEIALIYSDPEMLWVRDMVKTEYGYLVASTRNEQTKIVKTDFELNPLSFSMLDGYCRAIYATEEGNILIALQTSNSDHKILKIGINSETIWQVSADGIYNVFEVNGTNYAVGHHDGVSLFMMLDASGNIISNQSFGSGVISGHSLTSDGGLIFTGTTSYWTDQTSDTPVYKTTLEGYPDNRSRDVGKKSVFIGSSTFANPDINLKPLNN